MNIKNRATGETKVVHPDVSNLVWGGGDEQHQPLADLPARALSQGGKSLKELDPDSNGPAHTEGWYNDKVAEMKQVLHKLKAARKQAALSESSASQAAKGAGAFGRKGMVRRGVVHMHQHEQLQTNPLRPAKPPAHCLDTCRFKHRSVDHS